MLTHLLKDLQIEGQYQYEKATFDSYAKNYDTFLAKALRVKLEELDYYANMKIKQISLLKLKVPQKILDFGCGIGRMGNAIKQAFPKAELFGCDLSQESISIARSSKAYDRLFHASEKSLGRFAAAFDMVVVAGVLHHVPTYLRYSTAGLIEKLLNTDGELFVFEHNPLSPFARFAMKVCVFDHGCRPVKAAEVVGILKQAGLTWARKRYLLFFPAQLKRLV
jgi:predicted TPR repeat methyltransferase